MTFGSHVVMSMDTDHKGEIRRALTLALSFTIGQEGSRGRCGCGPQDDQEVEWALATRFQADRDLIVIPELRANPLTLPHGWTGEGFLNHQDGLLDATAPRKRGEKVDVPEEVRRRLSPVLKDLMGRMK